MDSKSVGFTPTRIFIDHLTAKFHQLRNRTSWRFWMAHFLNSFPFVQPINCEKLKWVKLNKPFSLVITWFPCFPFIWFPFIFFVLSFCILPLIHGDNVSHTGCSFEAKTLLPRAIFLLIYGISTVSILLSLFMWLFFNTRWYRDTHVLISFP